MCVEQFGPNAEFDGVSSCACKVRFLSRVWGCMLALWDSRRVRRQDGFHEVGGKCVKMGANPGALAGDTPAGLGLPGPPPAPRRGSLPSARRPARRTLTHALAGAEDPAAGGSQQEELHPPNPPPLRTNRTRRVLHPVLIGHAASFTPY